MIDMTHGGFEQRLRRRLAIFFLQIFSSEPALTPMRIGCFIASAIYNHADALFVADVARVDTQAVDAIFRHFQRNTVVKVDIGDQRTLTCCLISLNASAASIVGTETRTMSAPTRSNALI